MTVTGPESTAGHRIQASLNLLALSSSLEQIQGQLWRGAGLELEPIRYRILAVVERLGPVRLAVGAKELGLSAPAMSTHTGNLERLGLLERAPDPFDRRVTVIRLSSTGRLALDRTHRELARRVDLRLASWPEGEPEHLAMLLEQFVDLLRRGT